MHAPLRTTAGLKGRAHVKAIWTRGNLWTVSGEFRRGVQIHEGWASLNHDLRAGLRRENLLRPLALSSEPLGPMVVSVR